VLSLTLVIAGCSKTGSASGGNVSSPSPVVTSPVVTSTVVASAGGSACDRHLISEADVQLLLTGPITSVKPLPSDADSCVFATAGFSSITVTLRPGAGKGTLDSWRKGPVTPLAGVGDDAVWEADLKEVVASRGGALCTVTAMGPEVTPATAETEGAVCNKVFAGL
jgi:hypothetical protein